VIDMLRMDFNAYQILAQRTANTSLSDRERLAIAGLGLSGEAGEVNEIIKKHLGHGHGLDLEKIKKELGDVLWYVAEIAFLCNIPLQEVAETNIEKLASRYPEGFSEWRSQNRRE